MGKAIDAANFFIEIMKFDEDKPTNLKLNKLLYYAQGHALKRFGKTLFDEDIQAWDYGPVVETVYHTFKMYGNNGIGEVYGDFSEECFTEQEQRLLLDIARVYGQFTGTALIDKTHVKGGPWSQVYEQGVRNVVIPLDSIECYFKEHEQCEPFEINFCDSDYIDHIDDKGRYVLPKEWDDGDEFKEI